MSSSCKHFAYALDICLSYMTNMYDVYMCRVCTDKPLSVLPSLLLSAVAADTDDCSPDRSSQNKIVSPKIHIGIWFLSTNARTFQIIFGLFLLSSEDRHCASYRLFCASSRSHHSSSLGAGDCISKTLLLPLVLESPERWQQDKQRAGGKSLEYSHSPLSLLLTPFSKTNAAGHPFPRVPVATGLLLHRVTQ